MNSCFESKAEERVKSERVAEILQAAREDTRRGSYFAYEYYKGLIGEIWLPVGSYSAAIEQLADILGV